MMATSVGLGPARQGTRSGWAVAAVQLAYVCWFAVCVWVALAMARGFAGHLYVPHQGDQYTAEVDIWAGWPDGFRGPVTATAALQPFLAFFSVALSAWELAQWRVRANRPLFVTLIVTGVLVLATFVLTTIPAGRDITGWILD